MLVMPKKLRIAVITQNDEYAIPRNMQLLCESEHLEISELVIVDSTSSLENRKYLFLKGFGAWQSVKMALVTLFLKCRSVFALKLKFVNRPLWLNLKGLSVWYDVPLKLVSDINSQDVVERLREHDLDVIVSFSAPTIFREALLALPNHACINLHCSALPSYAGVMPSFWMLHNKESKAGVSVHVMDSKIDNGSVLAQEMVDISRMDSMYEVIQRTKLCGGQLMLRVLRSIYDSGFLPEPVDTSLNEESYFSWPKVQDFKNLRKIGKKLI